jgi:GntR family transcriptional repressor for pyruvate dehydrogenase complex
MLQPVKKNRLSSEVIDQISRSILRGDYQPGSKLPPEREIASQLGVSRTVVREALRSLEIMGLVESQVGGGTFVKEYTLEHVLDPIANYFSSDECLIDEIIETRKILEPEMVRLAAHRATPEDIDFIKKSVDQMNAEIEEGLSGINGDTAFHFALASAAHNSAMTKILSLIADLLHYTMKASLQAVPDQSVTLEGHRQILAAVERKDADMACKLMREHLEVSHARIKNRSKINSAD